MNNNYLGHIIRDLFPIHSVTICYGLLDDLVEELRKPLHGIGAFLLHSENDIESELDYKKYWNIELNDCSFSNNFCELFVSINYNPSFVNNDYLFMALNIKKLMKFKGIIFLVNPGLWASYMSHFFLLREDLIQEAKRFSILKDQEIYIYENI